jgi:hypothetical protein
MKFLQKNQSQFNIGVTYTNNTEALAQTPILDLNLGGAYGGRLTSCSVQFNSNFQTYAYIKITIDGIDLEPGNFQQPSQTSGTFNLVASGDYWELPSNSHLKIFAYNQGGASSTQSMLIDVIITAKLYPGPIDSSNPPS